MAKDYARKKRPAASRKRYEPKVPAWVWLFTGGVLGAFIMFLMHLTKVEDAAPSQLSFAKDAQEAVENKVDNQLVETEKPERPSSPFSFRDLLRDQEVKVEDEGQPGSAPAQAAPSYEYTLQVASFKTQQDADQVRAELILLNMDARIEKVIVRDNETWFRVVVGPFTSRSKLSKARSTLISNNYSAEVRKRVLGSG